MSRADDVLAHSAERAPQLAAPDMPARPRGRLAVLTCMDTRLEPLAMLGLERGEAHVIRNAGGLPTDDALRSLSASQRLLGTEEVLVVMHEGCGLLGASEDDFRRSLAADGALPPWRLGAFDDLDETLRCALERLRGARELPHRDRIRGLVFDPGSGELREVGAG